MCSEGILIESLLQVIFIVSSLFAAHAHITYAMLSVVIDMYIQYIFNLLLMHI